LFDGEGMVQTACLPLPTCTQGVGHGRLPGAGEGLVYGYRVAGPWVPQQGQRFNPAKVLLDPYARRVVGRYDGNDLFRDHRAEDPLQRDERDNAAVALKARVQRELPLLPAHAHVRVPESEAVLMELHVRGATLRHPQVPQAVRGQYGGLGHPAYVAHLKHLGVTTVSLLPLMQACPEQRLLAMGLDNYWGYNTLGWFCPDPRFWSGRPGTTPEGECREMVQALHRQGIEVVLDVVFNHSAEGGTDGPTFSLRGIDNRLYYRPHGDNPAHYENWSGCGNTLNVSQPRVLQLVMDALRFWVERIGVDGFRFDLAPVLGRTAQGAFDQQAAFFAALAQDPVLAGVKLIAEPWDLGLGGYQVGGFPQGWQEWNDRYRDTTRRYWLTGEATRAEFAHALAGSSSVFAPSGRPATTGINFISAHDGFTLRDAVSYCHRHNLANGEENRDGHGSNHSCNAGVEGPTQDEAVLRTRAQLQRAMLATLALSVGTPMLLGGDEIGHSQQGNNNAYCQDNELTWLNWPGADAALTQHVAACFALRRGHPQLRRTRWLQATDVAWLNPDGRPIEGHDDWVSGERALAAVFPGQGEQPGLALLFNPGHHARQFRTPHAPGGGLVWALALCSAPGDAPLPHDGHWWVAAHSVLVLTARGF
jgi:glycogen debranching enzyme